ncbi:MAG TPA: hypothetical protein VGF64_02125 [Acidimicrobiales bacterium]|jgi:hypothetical protein
MQTSDLLRDRRRRGPTTAERITAKRLLDYSAAGPTGSRSRRAVLTLAVVVGAALVATTGAIHLHLWASGYRTIPTIGPLFLFQGIAGAVLAVVLVVWRRLLTVVAAAGFMIATIGGLLLSVYVGLFGFTDTLAAPFAGMSLGVESAGAVVLGAIAITLVLGQFESDK